MKRNQLRRILLLAVLALPFSSTAQAEDAADIADALTSGKLTIGVRARYETVDQDGIDKDAQATTTRLRLNYRTGRWNGWSALVEFDHVFNVLLDDFNSGGGTSPAKAGIYPVVADPDGSDLNQMYVEYLPDPDWKLRVGREKIILDNHRFVGPVTWRQNEQTYDGLSVTTTAVRNTTIFYSFVTQVRRIFGQTVSAGTNDVATHLLNAKIQLDDGWTVTPYVYYIDNDDVPAFSTSTLGARLAGKLKAGDGSIALLGEFATQSDAADAPVNYDANYTHLVATWSGGDLSVGVGFESLGGNSIPDASFRTPLATLHAFNGWADVFLTTPDAGIDDTYLTVKYKAGKWNLTGVFHDFGAETGGGDFGTEIDLSAARKLSDRYSLLLKGALFSADSASTLTDTNKFWVMFTATY